MQKKIAVINDLSGYGRCSLTVAIPVLSAMGHQCCPIPTAILSNHTEFPVYFFDDYTEKMTTYTDKWKELGLSFDAIATGFLGSEAQIGIVMEIVQKLKAEKTFVVVDPVMGDHGHAYETYTPEMCEQMKELVCMADVVLPNVTECCILTDTPYREENWTRKELLNMAMMLRHPSGMVGRGNDYGSHHRSPRRQLLHERGPGTRADGSKIYQDKIFRRRASGNRRCIFLCCGGRVIKREVPPGGGEPGSRIRKRVHKSLR